jgi:micrococcal nuclease
MGVALLLPALAVAGKRPPAKGVADSVYDGDTFTLRDGTKVRVSGINTPELKPYEEFGIESRDAAREFLDDRILELSYGSTAADGYGRAIAWVEVDGKSLQVELIRQGLGHVFLIPPIESEDVGALMEAQAEAKAANLGIWTLETYAGSLHMTSFHANGAGDDNENPNGEYIRACNVTQEPVNIAGFSITNAAGDRYPLPDLTVPAGHTVILRSGPGEHQTNPKYQLVAHLGSEGAVWHNRSDTATIWDAEGNKVDARVHKSKSNNP